MNDLNRNFRDDEPDELWDDELEISSASVSRDSDSEKAYQEDRMEEDSDFYADNEEDEVATTDVKDSSADEIGEDGNRSSARRKLFSLHEEDDDFFGDDSEDLPEEKPKEKVLKLDPEDPDYWLDEESGISRILPNRKTRLRWWLAGIVVVVALLTSAWIWFFRPYIDDAVKYGYIKAMERRGTIIKTFEGVLIPYRELGDPTPCFFEEVRFSVEQDSLATLMKRMMLDCVPVRLEYKRYHTPLFWKGEESIVVTRADTADLNKILPPEFR